MGNGIWLTLAACICLFLSGFFYCFGSCCISNRPSRKARGDREADADAAQGPYADQMRMDAVKAEADRKARQKLGGNEAGLPAFHEYQPLTRKDSVDGDYYEDGDHIMRTEGGIAQNAGIGAGTAAYDRNGAGGQFAGGYAQGAAGTRAVDEYYSPTSNSQYPPQPQRQNSAHTVSASSYSMYSQSSSPAPPVPQLPLHLAGGTPNPYAPTNCKHTFYFCTTITRLTSV